MACFFIIRDLLPFASVRLDSQASMDATLRNLLQRAGFNSLDEVRAEGKAEGLADAARRLVASGMTVEQAATALGLEVTFVRAAVGEPG